MPSCSIKWCGRSNSTSGILIDGITFHRFPKDASIKEVWIAATQRASFIPAPHSVICSRHFTPDCFKQFKNTRRILSSAVPTLCLPTLSNNSAASSTEQSRNDSTIADPDKSSIKLEENDGDVETIIFEYTSDPEQSSVDKIIPGAPSPDKADAKYSIPKNNTDNILQLPAISNSTDALSDDTALSNEQLRKKIMQLKKIIQLKNRRIKRLKDSNKFLNKEIDSLKSLLSATASEKNP